MTTQKLNPSASAAPAGMYSHGVLAPSTGQWLHVSGQIGMRPDGSLGTGFAEQARIAWKNLMAAPHVTRKTLPTADHTFSRHSWHDQMAQWTREWVRSW